MKFHIAIFVLYVTMCAATCTVTTNARFKVELKTTWTNTNNPSATFPSGAHFSPPVYAPHKPGQGFWKVFGMATPGVQSVAETGSTSTISDELDDLKAAQTIPFYTIRSGMDNVETDTFFFTTSPEFSEISFISMIAPSPDWFIGAEELPLCDSSGNWLAAVSTNLQVYDAGTDSGTGFTSANSATTPHDAISVITGAEDMALFGGNKLGTLEITIEKIGDDLQPGVDASSTTVLASFMIMALALSSMLLLAF